MAAVHTPELEPAIPAPAWALPPSHSCSGNGPGEGLWLAPNHHCSDDLSMAEEVASAFGETATPPLTWPCGDATLDAVSLHCDSPSWLRSCSASSSQSMDLSKLVFASLDEDDSQLACALADVPACEPETPAPLLAGTTVHCRTAPLLAGPTAHQVWASSQRRLEGLMNRVIPLATDHSAAFPPSGTISEPAVPTGPKATNCQRSSSSRLPAVGPTAKRGVPLGTVSAPGLAPGRLEGLLSQALTSSPCLRTDSNCPRSDSNCPRSDSNCPRSDSNCPRNDTNIRHQPTAAPDLLRSGSSSSSLHNSEVPYSLADTHSPAHKKIKTEFHHGLSPLAPSPVLGASACEHRSAGQAVPGSDEDSGSAWDSVEAKPWSGMQQAQSQSPQRKRAHLGKKRVASERNRRSKIRDGLQQLKDVLNGQNDYAATLQEAVAYIKSLREEIESLKSGIQN